MNPNPQRMFGAVCQLSAASAPAPLYSVPVHRPFMVSIKGGTNPPAPFKVYGQNRTTVQAQHEHQCGPFEYVWVDTEAEWEAKQFADDAAVVDSPAYRAAMQRQIDANNRAGRVYG